MLQIETLTFNFLFLETAGWVAFAIRVALAAVLGLVLLGFARLIKRKLFPVLVRYAEKRNFKAVAILIKGFTSPTNLALRVIALLLALNALPWMPTVGLSFSIFIALVIRITIVIAISVGFWNAVGLVDLLFSGASSRFDFAENKTISMVLAKTYRVLVVIFCLFILMGEFNFEITALVTSLGLVGLTISLAAQDSASNLFAGFLLLIERPFNIGDWVNVNGTEGIVEDITFRSTKIRALDNSLYVLPNASVSGTTINNGTNREKRMYRFTLGVTYDTTRPQLEQLMADIEAMLKAHPHAVPDSALVRLSGFGDSSIDLLVNCYLDTVEMPAFLSVQNELHLNIMDIMAANNASFAFPSTSLYIEKNEAQGAKS